MRRLHDELTVVDGLQISNWDRSVLEEIKAGGVTGVNATCAVWEGPSETLRAIGDWYQLAVDNPDLVTLAETADDLRKAKQEGRVGVLLGFQNTSPFADDFRYVEIFSRLGVRVAQLTYNIQNLVGGSCYEPTDSGLTRFGRTVVAEMNRVGMLVDLSHVGTTTSRHAIDESSQPVAVTHSNPTWFHDSPRNKPDEVIDALAARGGVIGCCLYPNVLGGGTRPQAEFCAMVARLVDQVGPAHVAIGSDCTRNWDPGYVTWLRNGRWQPPRQAPAATWPQWPTWFGGPEDFPALTEALLASGLDEATVAGVLGENWLRLFDRVFPRTEPVVSASTTPSADRARDTVRVSLRDVRDCAFRCLVVSGASPGEARVAAEQVLFAEVHDRCGLEALRADLDLGAWPVDGVRLTGTEHSGRSVVTVTGSGTAAGSVLRHGWQLAGLCASYDAVVTTLVAGVTPVWDEVLREAARALGTPLQVTAYDDDGIAQGSRAAHPDGSAGTATPPGPSWGRPPMTSAGVVLHPSAHVTVTRSERHLRERRHEAAGRGVHVAPGLWTRLRAEAAAYLVAEA